MKEYVWNTGGINFKDITNQCTFSWATEPTEITGGTFPDSFLDGSHETKLEFYDTHTGAGVVAQLLISLPKACHFIILDDIGVGAQIGDDGDAAREVRADISILSERDASASNRHRLTAVTTNFSKRLRRFYQSFLQDYGDNGKLLFYSNTAGSYAWEIFNIRIIEIVGI